MSGSHRLKRWAIRHAHGLYLSTATGFTLLLTAVAVYLGAFWEGMPHPSILVLVLLAMCPVSEVAIGFLNRQWLRAFPARHLPRLALESGLDADMKTLVVVPTMLRSTHDAVVACRQLHVHALANPDPHMYFALLSDWGDCATQHAPDDDRDSRGCTPRNRGAQRRARASSAAGSEPKYFLLHRRRQWNDGERCFMGWERKRGKLEELNRLLHGSRANQFPGAGRSTTGARGYPLRPDRRR